MLKTLIITTAVLAMPLLAEGLKGRVYQDINGNGTFEKAIDKKLQYVNVTVTDSNGTTVHTQTNKYGIYTVTGISTGQALITIDEASIVHDTNTPFLQVDGFNPSTKVVRAGKANWSGKDGYSFTSVPTATVCGYIADIEGPLQPQFAPNVPITLTQGESIYHTISDSTGRYCANVNNTYQLSPGTPPPPPNLTLGTALVVSINVPSKICPTGNSGAISSYRDVYNHVGTNVPLLFNVGDGINEALPLISSCIPVFI